MSEILRAEFAKHSEEYLQLDFLKFSLILSGHGIVNHVIYRDIINNIQPGMLTQRDWNRRAMADTLHFIVQCASDEVMPAMVDALKKMGMLKLLASLRKAIRNRVSAAVQNVEQQDGDLDNAGEGEEQMPLNIDAPLQIDQQQQGPSRGMAGQGQMNEYLQNNEVSSTN